MSTVKTTVSTPHPAYQNSRVAWIGDVPEQWKVVRLKNICGFQYGDSLPEEERISTGVPVYGSNGLIGYTHTANTKPKCLIIGRKGSSGKVIYSDEAGFAIDTTFFIDRRHTTSHTKWLYYLLNALDLESLSGDVGVPGLNRTTAYQQICPLPTLEEQVAIAQYLDDADQRIQEYVSAKERLIALLEEKRQAIIHQAVTRSLDPNVKLKPSGVEWLGDVPEHWEVRRLKALCTMKSGDGITTEAIEATGKFPVYGGNGLRGYTTDYTHDGSYALIGRQGALCGNVHAVQGRFWASEHAVVASLHPGNNMKWFVALLEAMNLNQYSLSAAQPGLAVERVVNLWAPVPPPEEESRIGQHIGELTVDINDAVNRASRQNELIAEYRTRLIADVVTGKIDVS